MQNDGLLFNKHFGICLKSSKNNYFTFKNLSPKINCVRKLSSSWHSNESRINEKLELSFNDAWKIVDGTQNPNQKLLLTFAQIKFSSTDSSCLWQLQACDAKFLHFRCNREEKHERGWYQWEKEIDSFDIIALRVRKPKMR